MKSFGSPGTPRGSRRWRGAVILLVAVCVPAGAAVRHASAQAAAGAPAMSESTARRAALARDGEIFGVGGGEQKLYVVRRGGLWSLHAENLSVGALMTLWREAGGPEVSSKLPIENPTMLSVHDLAAERIVERLLDGYGYTLHYDAGGRLAQVRVYSPSPSLAMKTPRLVETLGQWREREAPRAEAPAEGALP